MGDDRKAQVRKEKWVKKRENTREVNMCEWMGVCIYELSEWMD